MVISDSITPTNINTKFKTVTVPVVTLDPQPFDGMGMTTTAFRIFLNGIVGELNGKRRITF